MDALSELIHDFMIISPGPSMGDIMLYLSKYSHDRFNRVEVEARLIILKDYFEITEAYEICAKIQHILKHENTNSKML